MPRDDVTGIASEELFSYTAQAAGHVMIVKLLNEMGLSRSGPHTNTGAIAINVIQIQKTI